MAWKFVSVALFVALFSLGVYTFWPKTSASNSSTNTVATNVSTNSTSTSPTASNTTTKNTKFATMLGFQSGQGFSGNKSLEDLAWTGWSNLRDSAEWSTFYTQLTRSFSTNVKLIKQTDFSSNRDVVGAFAWNVIQPTEGGDYDWTMPDATMKYAGDAGITIAAVVYPYGRWQTTKTIDLNKCAGIDFAFFDSHVGYPSNWSAYEAFLTATVERYDGDGVDDMPGLATRVEAWEIGNEVEGPCFDSSVADYLDYLKRSYAIVKAADANALVANAGALEIIGHTGRIQATEDFWKSFFAAGGMDYVDVFTVHYNAERAEVKASSADYKTNMTFFRDLLDEVGASDVPMWLTEFGLPTSTAYRTYVGIGDDLGVERYFLDLTGGDEGAIGPSALFKPTGQAREFLSTLQSL